MAHFFQDGRRTTRSTRVRATDDLREKAQRVADMWEQAAVLAGQGRDGRAWALATLNDIFARGGVPEIKEDFETWESAAKGFLANQKTRRKASASTQAGYKTGLKVFGDWLGARARKDIASITPKIVDQYAAHLQKRYAPATVVLRLTQISGVFSWAVRHEMLERNPVTRIETPEGRSMERVPFTPKEIGAMLALAREEAAAGRRHADELLTLLLFGLCTGARLGDCARMRWEHVELDKGVLSYLPQKKARGRQVLRVALVDPLLSHLRGLPRQGEWICPAFAPRPSGSLSALFRGFMERAGVVSERTADGRQRAFESKSFHGLRHTLATMLHEAGIDDLVRRRITGHEDRETAAIYQHVSVEATGEALRRVLGGIQNADGK